MRFEEAIGICLEASVTQSAGTQHSTRTLNDQSELMGQAMLRLQQLAP